jgi:hypothetical protein
MAGANAEMTTLMNGFAARAAEQAGVKTNALLAKMS